MDELEVLKRAQTYIEKLANGENPLDDSIISDDSVLNNIRISRCLFYVSGVLKDLISAGGQIQRPTKPRKPPFTFDPARADKIDISPTPISLSVLAKNISAAFPECKQLTYSILSTMLKDKGVLIDNPDPSQRPKHIANPHVKDNGIWSEKGFRLDGTPYTRTLYNESGQKLVISSLDDIDKYQ